MCWWGAVGEERQEGEVNPSISIHYCHSCLTICTCNGILGWKWSRRPEGRTTSKPVRCSWNGCASLESRSPIGFEWDVPALGLGSTRVTEGVSQLASECRSPPPFGRWWSSPSLHANNNTCCQPPYQRLLRVSLPLLRSCSATIRNVVCMSCGLGAVFIPRGPSSLFFSWVVA